VRAGADARTWMNDFASRVLDPERLETLSATRNCPDSNDNLHKISEVTILVFHIIHAKDMKMFVMLSSGNFLR